MQSQQNHSDKILLSIKHSGQSIFSAFKRQSMKYRIPKQSSVHQLRSLLAKKFKLNQKGAFFIYAYGNLLNNHQRVGALYEKYKQKINEKDGLIIFVAQMSTFGFN